MQFQIFIFLESIGINDKSFLVKLDEIISMNVMVDKDIIIKIKLFL